MAAVLAELFLSTITLFFFLLKKKYMYMVKKFKQNTKIRKGKNVSLILSLNPLWRCHC